ncbi:MAG: Ribosomal small subunit methyltransferase [Patescibacteria group bacterium]|nr:Ribosomal small subunit methyltransferase [Patescibacteria group bacterium]
MEFGACNLEFMSIHKPVLLKETIELLNLKEGMTVMDATLGGGGHSREILKKIGDVGKLIAIDLDEKAVENFRRKNKEERRKQSKNIILVNGNFADLEKILTDLKIRKVDAILADLGWSSDQMGDAHRGMSFLVEAELDMRLSLRITNQYECTNSNPNAKCIVNNYSERELGRIIKEYGEERFWKNIARKIVEYRRSKEIETTKELAKIIESAVPGKYSHGKIHPATRTFQAIRIEVNQELKNLERFIPQAISVLAPGGRLAIISFHSLEDRIVKTIYRANARGRVRTDEITGQAIVETAPEIKIITKKPVTSGEDELEENPRARSAKLRVCERR